MSNMISRERKLIEALLVKKTRVSKAGAAALSDVQLATQVLAACGRRTVSKDVAVAIAKAKLELECKTKRGG